LLCQLAANNNLLHIDDTHLKIIDEIIDNRKRPDKARRGMFTTGILAKFKTHKIILYFNGTDHAGENLDNLLKHRRVKESLVIMSDALSRNIPSFKNIISCFCLSHGYRKFDELKSFYTVPCEKVVSMISQVYKVDAQTIDMTDRERLKHHQKHSKPMMDKLYEYLNFLLDEKLVEPNDNLGKAINYMLKHKHELTQFLRVEGVPLDNNDLEQCLKIPIRHRKNSMFYKTKYGASIGGILTSVIYTCILSGINPVEYLTMLQVHKDQIIKEPSAYLPWTYQDTLSEPLAA
jgi:transposase